MLQIDFTTNPNGKLFNDHFGDIRLQSQAFLQDVECEIILKNSFLGYARIEAVRNFPIARLSDAVSYLNCGKSAAYQVALLNRFYNGGQPLPRDTVLSHLIFCYSERKMETQSTLLKDWWDSKMEPSKLF